jgi:hypothetical protein
MLVQVTGTTLVRDTKSMGLINCDLNGLQEYENKRSAAIAQRNQINTLKSEIENIKGDVAEIKQLMLKLLDKGSNG